MFVGANSSLFRRVCCKWLLLLFCGHPLGAASWTRVQADGLEVLSDAGAASARESLHQLQQIRSVFRQLLQSASFSPMPVRVFVFATPAEYAQYRIRSHASGFYQSGPERDYIVLQAGGPARSITFHEFTHVLMAHTGLSAPLWLNEGMAEFFSTTSIRNGEVRLGGAPADRLKTLRNTAGLRLQDLFRVDSASAVYGKAIFYAQSWALVHLLVFSPDYTGLLAKLIQAKNSILEQDLPRLQHDLQNYVAKAQFRESVVKLNPLTQESAPQVELLGATAAAVALADLAVALSRPEQAEAVLKPLRQSNNPEVHIALGEVALSSGDDATAKNHFERALALGSTSGRLRWDYAMLLRDSGAPESAVVVELRRAVQIEPNLFDAHLLLGTWALRDGRKAEAEKHLEVAMRLRPGRVDAAEQLQSARTSEASPVKQSTHPTKPAPDQVEGMLSAVDCLGPVARLTILTKDGKQFLLVRDPSAVTITNAGEGHTELPCGSIPPRQVRVEYTAHFNATYRTIGDVRSITWK